MFLKLWWKGFTEGRLASEVTLFLLLTIWYSKKNVFCSSKHLHKMLSFQFHQLSIPTKDPKGLSDTVVTGMTIHRLWEGSSLSHFPGAVRHNFQTPELLDTPTITLHREIKNRAVIILLKLYLALTLSRKENNWNVIKKGSSKVSCRLPIRQGVVVVSSPYTIKLTWENYFKNERKTWAFLVLGKGRQPHGQNFNISACLSTSQLSPRASKSSGLLCTYHPK